MKLEKTSPTQLLLKLNLDFPIEPKCTPEYYSHLVEHLDEFSFDDALLFERINRQAPIYEDMVGKYNGPQRVGLFANSYYIEEFCTRARLNPFNLFKYPIKFQFGDDTHIDITGGEGNYAPDLLYKSSGSSGITFSAEVKSYSGQIDEALRTYGFKDTTTGFPYNSTFLILYNRDLNTYKIVAEDKEYFNFNTKSLSKLSEFEERIIEKDGKTKSFRVQTLDEISGKSWLSEKIHDVHSIKWNRELIRWAEFACDEAGIQPKIRPRKNF